MSFRGLERCQWRFTGWLRFIEKARRKSLSCLSCEMRTEKILDSKFRTNKKKYFLVLCRVSTVGGRQGAGHTPPPPEMNNRTSFPTFFVKEKHKFYGQQQKCYLWQGKGFNPTLCTRVPFLSPTVCGLREAGLKNVVIAQEIPCKDSGPKSIA